MKVLGTDPGFTGACAIFGHAPSSNRAMLLDVYDFRTVGEGGGKRIDIAHFQSWIQDHRPEVGYCEQANAMPAIPNAHGHRAAMGAGTISRYMRCAGHIEATIVCCGVDLFMCQPSQWKRRFGLVGPNKGNSIDLALALSPEAARWVKLKKHHNRAEAILIGVWGAERQDLIDLAPME